VIRFDLGALRSCRLTSPARSTPSAAVVDEVANDLRSRFGGDENVAGADPLWGGQPLGRTGDRAAASLGLGVSEHSLSRCARARSRPVIGVVVSCSNRLDHCRSRGRIGLEAHPEDA